MVLGVIGAARKAFPLYWTKESVDGAQHRSSLSRKVFSTLSVITDVTIGHGPKMGHHPTPARCGPAKIRVQGIRVKRTPNSLTVNPLDYWSIIEKKVFSHGQKAVYSSNVEALTASIEQERSSMSRD